MSLSCNTNNCPDVCRDICISADLQRGAVQTTVEVNTSDSPSCIPGDETAVTRHLFCFNIVVNNCTGRTINNFRPLLDLTPTFLLESTGVPIQASCTGVIRNDLDDPCLVVSDIAVSIGDANVSSPPAVGDFNGGLSGPIGDGTICEDQADINDGIKTLLKETIALPPGESHFDVWVYIDIENTQSDNIILFPGIFSFNGQIECCDGQCLPVHKALLLPCECLDSED